MSAIRICTFTTVLATASATVATSSAQEPEPPPAEAARPAEPEAPPEPPPGREAPPPPVGGPVAPSPPPAPVVRPGPPIGEPRTDGSFVPEGYTTLPPPSIPGPSTTAPPSSSAADEALARKIALRRTFRLSIGAGLASTAGFYDFNGDGKLDTNLGWAGLLSVGWRYRFARFGAFQIRFLFLVGGYQGDPHRFDVRGGELGLLSQATIRFVGGPFYLGIGTSVGFFSQVHLATDACLGLTLEAGFVVGHHEQVELGAQLTGTTGVVVFGGQLTWSFGRMAEAPSP